MTAEQLARIKTFEGPKACFDDEWYEAEREQCRRELAKKNGSHAPERFCDCRELLIDGERQPCPPRHSCEYVRLRSELVPIAARTASERGQTTQPTVTGGRATSVKSWSDLLGKNFSQATAHTK